MSKNITNFLLIASGITVAYLSVTQGGLADHHKRKGASAAVVQLKPLNSSGVNGRVKFIEKDGKTRIEIEAEGLQPGKHGFHVHQFGDCSAEDGSSAGGHFAGKGKKHGAPDDDLRHAGDLGNIAADSTGKVKTTDSDTLIKLHGKNSIIGRSVIVHKGQDDFTSQPSGDAGKRVACGIIGVAKTES